MYCPEKGYTTSITSARRSYSIRHTPAFLLDFKARLGLPSPPACLPPFLLCAYNYSPPGMQHPRCPRPSRTSQRDKLRTARYRWTRNFPPDTPRARLPPKTRPRLWNGPDRSQHMLRPQPQPRHQALSPLDHYTR